MRLALIGALILLALLQIAGAASDIAGAWRDYRGAVRVTELKAISTQILLGTREVGRERQMGSIALARAQAASADDLATLEAAVAQAGDLLSPALSRLESQPDPYGIWARNVERLRETGTLLERSRPAMRAALVLPAAQRDAESALAWLQSVDRHAHALIQILRLLNQPPRESQPLPVEQAILSGLRMREETVQYMLDLAMLAAAGRVPDGQLRETLRTAALRSELAWQDLDDVLADLRDPALLVAATEMRYRFETALRLPADRLLAGETGPEVAHALATGAAAVLGANADLIALGVQRADKAAEAQRMQGLGDLMRAILMLFGSVLAIAVAVMVVRNRVLRPIGQLAGVLQSLADGDNTVAVPAVDDEGEVGRMARAVAVLKGNAQQQERDGIARRRAERLLQAERGILEMVAGRAPLDRILRAICDAIEERLEGAACSIMLLLPDGVRMTAGAAPSLPADYMAALEETAIGPNVGSCGTALWRREAVVVTDIANDPLWAGYVDLATAHGLCACWSLPILAPDGQPLGAFAVYYRTPRAPRDWEMEHAQRASNLAAIAIGGHRADEALREAKAQAELGSRTKSEFLANMSHELRTPLNAIIGFAEVLEGELRGMRSPLAEAGYVDDIIASGRHLLNLINDILDVSKMEAGKVELRERVCDIGELLSGCERIVRARAMERRIDLQLVVPVGMPPILVDDVKFKQIVLNLLSNAVKFTGPGGTISVSVATDARLGIRVLVRDTGIGIKQEDLPQVFVPFHQVDNIYARINPGTGLGLSLSRGLAELHGGTLTLDSEFGVGTTAILTLPPSRLLDGEAGAAVPRLRGLTG
ncbi:MAG: non-motile and phage-resistance protein [Pseudomonadota bacterium]|jgi:signal transduction histidine kinase/HAMP domain-containing protein